MRLASSVGRSPEFGPENLQLSVAARQVDHHCGAGRWSGTEGSGFSNLLTRLDAIWKRGRSARAVAWSLSFPGQVRLTSRRKCGITRPVASTWGSVIGKKSVFIFNSLNGPNLCYTVRFCFVFFYMNEINTCSMFSYIMCLWRASDRMSRDPQATCCNIGWRCEAAAIYFLFKSSLVTVINFF